MVGLGVSSVNWVSVVHCFLCTRLRRLAQSSTGSLLVRVRHSAVDTAAGHVTSLLPILLSSSVLTGYSHRLTGHRRLYVAFVTLQYIVLVV